MFDSYCIPMNASAWPESTLPERIIKTISQELEVSEDKIKAPGRGNDEIVFARHLCIVLLKRRTALSPRELAIMFGRSRKTIYHAFEAVSNYEESCHSRAKVIERYLNREY